MLILLVIVLVARFRFPVARPVALFPLVYVGMETLSTLLNPDDWSRGFKLDLLLAVEAVLAIGAAWLARSLDVRTIARTIVGAGALAAGVAIALTILYHLRVTGFGVQVDPVTGLCKTYGTMWEANLLGSYLAATLVFSFAVGALLGPAWFALASRSVMVLAVGLTLSRAVWFAALVGVVGLLALAVLEGVRWRARQLVTTGGGFALAVVITGVLVQLTASHPCGRVLASELSTQGSITGRFSSHILALNEWTASPFWGLGTGSTRAHLPGDANQPWISSFGVGMLHDTGVIGFVLITGLLGLLLWTLVRWHLPPVSSERWLRYGLAAAILTLLVAFQATTGDLMEYPWLFVGTAIGMLYRRQARSATSQSELARTA